MGGMKYQVAYSSWFSIWND